MATPSRKRTEAEPHTTPTPRTSKGPLDTAESTHPRRIGVLTPFRQLQVEPLTMGFDELRDALRARPDLEAGTPLPMKEIDVAERQLGSLPEDYRAFLQEFGWVSLGPHEVFGLAVDVPPYLDVVRVNESEWTEGQLPRNLLAVMNDGAGNLSCIDLTAVSRGDVSTVVLWDHEVSPIDGPIPLTSTFSELLGKGASQRVGAAERSRSSAEHTRRGYPTKARTDLIALDSNEPPPAPWEEELRAGPVTLTQRFKGRSSGGTRSWLWPRRKTCPSSAWPTRSS